MFAEASNEGGNGSATLAQVSPSSSANAERNTKARTSFTVGAACEMTAPPGAADKHDRTSMSWCTADGIGVGRQATKRVHRCPHRQSWACKRRITSAYRSIRKCAMDQNCGRSFTHLGLRSVDSDRANAH